MQFSADCLVVIRKITTFAENYTNMGIQIISAKQFATKLKATIQKSGRLGFTEDTAKVLDFQSGKRAKFAKDDERRILYLVIISEDNEDAFPIRESSGYYYVPARQMFDMLGFDYENYYIIFDLIREKSHDAELQGMVFRMKERLNKRKEKNEEKEIG